MRKDPRFDDSEFPEPRKPWRDWMGGSSSLLVELGQTTEEIAAASTGTFEFFSGTLGAETTTGQEENGYNRGDLLPNGTWVNAIRRPNGWEIFPIECP